ncbi:MAG: ribosome hibernation-promoting factor, HPF/YfiA family [Planctomycetota bacterium]
MITGRNVGVTESMKNYAREKVEKLRKYYDRATLAQVTMDVERDSHRVEIVFDVPRAGRLVGKAEAPDMYAACDLAEQKLAGQLRRFSERLKDHHRGERATPAAMQGAGAPLADAAETYEDVIDRMRQGE